MRTPFIAGNWKLNKTVTEAVEFVTALKEKVKDVTDVEIGVCPPSLAIKSVCDVLKGSNIGVGAQNVYWEDSGAFTGELSVDMLLDAGCTYTLVGHSERRQYFFETNECVNKKMKKALEKGLKPIMCVGEKLEERRKGDAKFVVEAQTREGLKDISKDHASDIVIAYEPVWAIGTGETATPEIAQEMHEIIRAVFAESFSQEDADQLRIQYGGSVKPDNVAGIMAKPDVDGALVGGAALDVDSFTALVCFEGK